MHEPELGTRPATPESLLAGSLHHVDTTMDDLTVALANFSRLPSPDLPATLVCCCGKEDCQNTNTWLALKSKLESRLILSAEVGQALLQKHEAYMRRYEESHARRSSLEAPDCDSERDPAEPAPDTKAVEFLEENRTLRKGWTQARLDLELVEASNKKLSDELEEARSTISQLSAHHARSVGLEGRLHRLSQEMDDMRQERDSEAQRAKLGEARMAVLTERLHTAQAEVRRLQDDLEIQRTHRLESSEDILQNARKRLHELHRLDREKAPPLEEEEVMKVLQALVSDNELLKKDNEELQLLLSHSRDDLQAVREELEEQRVQSTYRETIRSAPYQLHRHQPSYSKLSHSPGHLQLSGRRDMGRTSPRLLEAPTPEAERPPLSPSDSHTSSDTKWSSSKPRPNISVETEDSRQRETVAPLPLAHKSLFLLSQSRGVQTDDWPGLLFNPPPYPDAPLPNDQRSEASSLTTESQSTALSSIVERVNALLHRMTQADALSLTNRLKRQHLKGADVRHLSRTTVSTIVTDATNLRLHFRALLEDDKVPISCTRKDLRGLFKIFREVFMEMGEMRVTLNDVILDPSIAAKIRESALNPTKANSIKPADATTSTPSWMAPIAKLFASGHQNAPDNNTFSEPPTSTNKQAMSRPSTRVIPKLGPALAASATTVNVEFSGIGAGRSITSTASAGSLRADEHLLPTDRDAESRTSTKVMGIFAGAPRVHNAPDKWVKIETQETLRRARSKLGNDRPPGMLGEGEMARNRMSRNVDAVIDHGSPHEGEEADYVAPLLQRTLRRRGLSDSSIHSTFASHGDEPKSPLYPSSSEAPAPRETLLSKDSVLWALSRRVQNLRLGVGGFSADVSSSPSGSDSAPSSPPKPSSILSRSHPHQRQPANEADGASTSPALPRRTASPMSAFVPNISLSSWAEAAKILDPVHNADADIHVGSWREDAFSHLPSGRDAHDREYL